MPARTVNPTSLAAVASGRQEGHLFGSRIVQLGFVAGRHTAIVSADDQGLAFYHSLGKVLFVDAIDVLRILGKYPEEDPIPPITLPKQPFSSVGTLKASARNRTGSASPSRPRPRHHRKANTILSMVPLPLGTSPHPTDSYQLVALITPVKLVVVGLKPSPKTWCRRHREGDEEDTHPKSKWKACLAWFPSVTVPTHVNGVESTPAKVSKSARTNGKDDSTSTVPILAFSWGRTLSLLRVFESRIIQKVRNQKTGKSTNMETGKVNFEEHGGLSLDKDILAIQWLNVNVGSFSSVS